MAKKQSQNDQDDEDSEDDNSSSSNKKQTSSSSKSTDKSDNKANNKTNDKTKKKSGMKGWQAGLIALIVIVLVVYALYVVFGSLPSSLLSKLLSSTPLNGATLKSLLLQKVVNSPEFAVNYSGNVSFNGQDPNIAITLLKYHTITRLTYALNNIPFIGTGDITTINSTNDSSKNEICVPTNLALFSQGLSKNATSYCANENSTNYQELVAKLNSVLNVSATKDFHISSYGLGMYNLQPCYKLSGNGNVNFNRALINESGVVNATATFTTCLSAQYDIPLTLSGNLTFPDANGTRNDTIGFSIGEVHIGTSTTESQVLQTPVS